jgi:hypothetical protein
VVEIASRDQRISQQESRSHVVCIEAQGCVCLGDLGERLTRALRGLGGGEVARDVGRRMQRRRLRRAGIRRGLRPQASGLRPRGSIELGNDRIDRRIESSIELDIDWLRGSGSGPEA